MVGRFLFSGVLVAALLLGGGVIQANAGASNRLGNGPAASSPVGFQIFCLKNPRECRASGNSQISLNNDSLSALQAVNSRVNRSINPRADGRRDVWSLDVRSGDCEEYVLAKRKKLVEAGLPASALRIAHVRTRRGEDHAVLLVMTNEGDLVLDNLTSSIKLWEESGHRMMAMSGANPLRWTAY